MAFSLTFVIPLCETSNFSRFRRLDRNLPLSLLNLLYAKLRSLKPWITLKISVFQVRNAVVHTWVEAGRRPVRPWRLRSAYSCSSPTRPNLADRPGLEPRLWKFGCWPGTTSPRRDNPWVRRREFPWFRCPWAWGALAGVTCPWRSSRRSRGSNCNKFDNSITRGLENTWFLSFQNHVSSIFDNAMTRGLKNTWFLSFTWADYLTCYALNRGPRPSAHRRRNRCGTTWSGFGSNRRTRDSAS